MYENLLLEQMKKLKQVEALIKEQVYVFTAQLNKIWQIEDEILDTVKDILDKEEKTE